MLSIAQSEKERESILDMIRETIENLRNTRPTFSSRQFIQSMAQAAYPNDPSPRMALIDEVRGLTTSAPMRKPEHPASEL